ncbi:MAG TPA: FtsW/RodA/SpoVE family cell cycle protein, partial [Chloroflexota bacterium]|nr:FtsW/RodA/SpoVE family cell cycle protein [Chloroflexota bacterium]
ADQQLLPIVLMLVSVGLVTISRLSPELAARQFVWIGVGCGLTIVTLWLPCDLKLLQSYKYTAAALGILLVAATFFLGKDPNNSGVRSWFGFGDVWFQPSEILKVLLVIFLAGYLEDKRELLEWSSTRLGGLKLPPLPYLGPLAVMWAISMLLLVGQRDIGAALLFFCIFLSMLYIASSRSSYLWGGLVSFGAGAFLCYLLFSVVRLRVDVWLDPWSKAQQQGYQVVQALVALASGGILGSGLGFGHPDYIPAVSTDFVIAAIGEEMGLAGTLAVVALFMLLVYRGFRIALEARNDFSVLLAAGLTAVLGFQAVVILAGTAKLIPLTGITLPFISYGGSSITTNFIILGLLLRISQDTEAIDAA